MNKNAKIYVAGHRGLVGSAIHRSLIRQGFDNLIARSRSELDLLKTDQVNDFFKKNKPEYVFLAAAKVGGILANKQYKADFIYQNLQVQNNVIEAAHQNGVKKLVFLGSSCIYPRDSQQPIKEEYLLAGPLEETNDAYAIAKIAGIKMCQSYWEQHGDQFISVMPTNLYGFNDNFNLQTAHVLPAMLRKFHEAKKNNQPTVTLWGTGTAKREFLFVDDMADACVYLMNNYAQPEIINIGTGEDVSIKELAQLIQKIVGYQGEIQWDNSKPDGTPRKLLDVTRLHQAGWQHQIPLEDGIKKTYQWFLDNQARIRL